MSLKHRRERLFSPGLQEVLQCTEGAESPQYNNILSCSWSLQVKPTNPQYCRIPEGGSVSFLFPPHVRITISELWSHYELESQLITGRMWRLIEHLLGIYHSIGLAYLLFVYLANSFGPRCCRPLWGKLNCNYSQKFNSFCDRKSVTSVYFQTR